MNNNYYLRVLLWSSLKNAVWKAEFGGFFFQTKSLQRLSNMVCRILSSVLCDYVGCCGEMLLIFWLAEKTRATLSVNQMLR